MEKLATKILNAGRVHVVSCPAGLVSQPSGLSSTSDQGDPNLFVKIHPTVEPGVIPMHRLLLSARSVVTVVGTLVLLIVTVVVSDVVAAPGIARDVLRTTGAQLVALGGSAWQKRCANRKIVQVCARCRGVVRDSGPL